MDKPRPREVRRGATRFKHSRPKLSSGVVSVFSEKSKKEKVRKLSAVGRSSSRHEDCQMGFDASDREDELRTPTTSKRFKLSEMFSDDCNGVGHASVPRKLRSAIKNRGRDSISPPLPDSNELNHTIAGIHSPKMSAMKKSKSNVKQRGYCLCPKRSVSGPITKDEEEVAETLYALAGMFSNNNSNDKSKQDYEALEPKPLDLPALEENRSSASPLMTDEATVPSSSVEKLAETVKVDSLNGPSSQVNLTSLDDSVPQVNPLTLSSSAKSEEQCDAKPMCRSVKFCTPSELQLDAGLKVPQQKEASLLEKKPEIGLGMATPMGSQMEPRKRVGKSKKTGLALWPGLPSIVSQGAGVDDPCFRSTPAKIPTLLDVPFSALRTSSVQDDSSRTVCKVTSDRKLAKRCATHVYISRLIQALKMSESKDRLTLPQNQMRPQEEGLKQGVSLTNNNFYGLKNGINGIVSAGGITNAIANENTDRVTSGALQQRDCQDWALSEQCALQKLGFDFLSLSAGGSSGLEVSDRSTRTRNGFEPLSPLQVPYLHSRVQHQFRPPFSLPESAYNSSAYPDHLSSARQLHPCDSPFYSSQASSAALTKQQQEQRQRLWAAHYRPDDTPKTTVHFLNWQNGAMTQRYQQQQQQQQQQLMAITSSPFPSGKVIRQEYHMPSVYEEPGGGFHTSALPLQLLCNERL
ncbi:hypothetical protein PanWU01x14_077600 [Parasponia andersonii]|uniref:Uncharacterized protein n=1 Tax=Parasponia andersonii TaxID=3476 RepID=A0A2P5DBR4_PARAD|nr:hypothetical protein PanWU01x14_077600 [Parasponia andersonii]